MFFQQFVNGLLLGGGYALISIGLTMSFGIMNISNFAHGTIYMLGGYSVYFFCTSLGLPYLLSVPLSMLAVGLIGILIERVVFRPTYEAPPLSSLLISLGLLIFLENGAQLLWTAETLGVKTPYTNVALSIFSATLTLQRLIVIAASLFFIGILYLFLNFTRMGKAIVATSQSAIGASLVGIHLPKVYILTFAISSALAAAAGALLAPLFYVNPTMGTWPVLKAWVVVVLGGLGNVQGAVVGGFLVGLAESLGGAYISSEYKNAFPFFILIAALLIRPQGIFGKGTNL